jgi:hypothetical protein
MMQESDLLSSGLPKTRFLKCLKYLCPGFWFSLRDFGLSVAEMLDPLLHRIPEIPKPGIPEMLLPGSSPFVLSEFQSPKCSEPLVFETPEVPNSDTPK